MDTFWFWWFCHFSMLDGNSLSAHGKISKNYSQHSKCEHDSNQNLHLNTGGWCFRQQSFQVVSFEQRLLLLGAQACIYLNSNTAPGAVVMHEDTQHVRDELRQVKFELSPQGHDNLFNQKDDGVLHGIVWCPVFLQNNKYFSVSLTIIKKTKNEIRAS